MTYLLIWLAVAYICAVIACAAAICGSNKRERAWYAIGFVIFVTAAWPILAGMTLRTMMLRARDALVAKWKARRLKA